jgi:hypothetical protein
MDMGICLSLVGGLAAILLLADVFHRALVTRRGGTTPRTALSRLFTWPLVILVVIGLVGGLADLWLVTHPVVGS